MYLHAAGEIAAIVTCTGVAVLIAMIVSSAFIWVKFKNDKYTRSFKSELR